MPPVRTPTEWASYPTTREQAIESLKNLDLGGLLPPVTYGTSTNDRVPTRDNIVYAIDATQPTGVKALSDDFTGTAAQKSQF